MGRIDEQNLLQKIKHTNDSIGVFQFLQQGKIIFVKCTDNLRKSIMIYSDTQHENSMIAELANQIDDIITQQYPLQIEAFINELFLIKKFNPEYNKRIKPWYNYSYLGIDLEQPPYFHITNDTIQDLYYIGPFRSSFILTDILDVFAELFKLPRCEHDYPCERINLQQCLGFCHNKLGEALPELINRLLMVPNRELLNKLKEQQKLLFQELKFNEGELLGRQISLISRYYKNLIFSYISPYINGEFPLRNETIVIDQGMIKEIISENDYLEIKNDLHIKKKNQEILAFDKSEYDHRWIVFNYFFHTDSQLIEHLFKENVVNIQKKLFLKSE